MRNLFTLSTLSLLLAFATPAISQDRPHIVVLLADDLGNVDLGYRGSEIRTPNIDALAMGGARLESYYGLPLCSPARAALMTGRYPMRHGLQTAVIFPSHTYGLPLDEVTLPQTLQSAGYRTAIFGKWHLGHADRAYWPQNRGFDSYYGNLVGEVDYFTKERGGIIDWQRDGTFLQESGYHTTLLGDAAVELISEHDVSRPLFMYVPFLAAHAPYQAPEEYIAMYADVFDDPTRQIYAAMITAVDDQIGRIVAALEDRGLRENTLIYFTSDNGGIAESPHGLGAPRTDEEREESGGAAADAKPPGSNGGFRAGKGTLYEGGVRLPAIVNWPGRIEPRVIDEPHHHVDLMPTLLAAAGVEPIGDLPFDGISMWPLLSEGIPSPHDDILINVEVFRGAIRRGDWKLIKVALLPGRTELYNVVDDPGETTNLAEQHPEIVADLEQRLRSYAGEMKPARWILAQPAFLGAQGTTVLDPDFDIDDGGLPHEKPALAE